MKKPAATPAMLTPAADGWLLHEPAGAVRSFGTLSEVAAALPAGSRLELALPCSALVIEGLRLPATEDAELAGMVRLQLEKNLPFPLEEVSTGFLVVEKTEKDSAVVSLAVTHAALETLCQPLRERGLLPERVTPYVLHVAAACPADETVLAVYPEQGQCVLMICAGGQLCWAHVIADTDPARFGSELQQALLAATLEGAPGEFARVLLAPEADALAPMLREDLAVPVKTLSVDSRRLNTPLNLVPPAWRSTAQQQVRMERLRQQLIIGAGVYAAIIIAALVYGFFLRREAAQIAAEIAAAQPKLEFIQVRQARSNALAAAFDSSRTTVELLFLVQRALPDESTRITEFDQQPDQWRVVGEATNATLATDYVGRLKADSELSAYEIAAGPPQLLPNEHAQFNIFGKR